MTNNILKCKFFYSVFVVHCDNCHGVRNISPHFLRFLTEEEDVVEFGLTEAAADSSDGTVVCSTMIKPPKFKELGLTSHVLSKCFKT